MLFGRRAVVGFAVLVVVACLGAPASAAELEWRPVDGPARPDWRSGVSTAYDDLRHEVLLFGGYTDELWGRRDGAWRKHPGGPPPKALSGMAFDAARGETVLFGGGYEFGVPHGDTWTWDGTQWKEHPTPPALEPRLNPAMAYDSVRQEVVLFGGLTGSAAGTAVPANDTWVWDGISWEKKTPATTPPGRNAAQITWDPVREEVVLFGGEAGAVLSDTWTWDGENWTQESPATVPTKRFGAHFAFDPRGGHAVLFSGSDGQITLTDTWVWDGTNWIQQSPEHRPDQRYLGGMVFDKSTNELLLMCGSLPGGDMTRDLWAWTGTDWVERTNPISPGMLFAPKMTFDEARGEAVLFGGDGAQGLRDDTWIWDGARWSQREPEGARPPARDETHLAYDAARERVVMFGGFNRGPLGDTWLWDGTSWTAGPAGPPVRSGGAIGYDPVRKEIVLFGGSSYVQSEVPVVGPFLDEYPMLADTWVWNGTAWEERTPATAPSARMRSSLAWDPVAQELVMFGGLAQDGTVHGDTWAWTGTGWEERPAVASPPPASAVQLATEPASGKVVYFGRAHQPAETWVWEGDTWTKLETERSPSARSLYAIASDTWRQGIVLFGGNPLVDDTWRIAPPAEPLAVTATTPGDGEFIRELAGGVSVTYGGRIVRAATTSTVIGPDGEVAGELEFAPTHDAVTWHPAADMADGAYTARVETIGADGDALAKELAFVIDRTPPDRPDLRAPAIVDPAKTPKYAVEVAAEPGATGHLVVEPAVGDHDLRSAAAGESGVVRFELPSAPLRDGPVRLVATASDTAGNPSAAARATVTALSTPPATSRASPMPVATPLPAITPARTPARRRGIVLRVRRGRRARTLVISGRATGPIQVSLARRTRGRGYVSVRRLRRSTTPAFRIEVRVPRGGRWRVGVISREGFARSRSVTVR
jgi:methionine-rich copper-binding protein CopC